MTETRKERFLRSLTFVAVGAFVLFVLVMLAIGMWSQARAAGPIKRCDTYANMIATLQVEYKEQVLVTAKERGMPVEFFVSKAGTWTMVIKGRAGIVCIVTDGTDWKLEGEML